MKLKSFLAFLTTICMACFLSFATVAAPVSATKAKDFINQTGYRLIEALGNQNLQEKYAVLDDMFQKNVDMPYLARFVMGKYFKQMTEEQKQTYLALFPRYVIGVYKSYPLNFGTEGLSFEILSTLQNGNFTDVLCRINLPESLKTEQVQSIDVSFKLEEVENQPRIVDLKIGESSLLVSYRKRFYEMIMKADEDMSWFLEDFAALTESAERNAEEKLLRQ